MVRVRVRLARGVDRRRHPGLPFGQQGATAQGPPLYYSTTTTISKNVGEMYFMMKPNTAGIFMFEPS